MANIMLGWPQRAASATLSAGSWDATFADDNMLLAETAKVARSTNDLKTSTQIRIDLGAAKTIRVISEHQHNFTQAAKRKVSAGTTAGASDVYAGDWEDVFDLTWAETGIEWQDEDNWWGPEIDSTIYGCPFMGLCVLPSDTSARYWTIEWDIEAGSLSYLQIGRLFMGPAYQPEFNAVYGLVDGWKDYSTQAQLEAGGIVSYPRRAARTVEFSFPMTGRGDEEYRIREMLRLQRTGGDVLYIPDPARLGQSQMKGFLGRLSELSGMSTHLYRRRSIDLRMVEKL